MDTIIGLGSAGCKIAEQFSKFPQYNIYKIDNGLIGKNCFNLKKQSSVEDYEKNCPDMSEFFSNISDEVLFIIGGGGKISAATLAILKQIRHKKINILYIYPSVIDLTSNSKLQNRLTFNILQEYARSGLLEKVYLISNDSLEECVGDVPITQHLNKMNELIVNTIHYINYFNNTDPIVDSSEDPRESSRIATFGTFNLNSKEEVYFFPINFIKDKKYYFGLSEDSVNNDGKILKNIKESIYDKEIQVSFQIHQTNYQENFCYFIAYSNIIQQLDN